MNPRPTEPDSPPDPPTSTLEYESRVQVRTYRPMKVAELLIGIGWTACGFSTLLTVLFALLGPTFVAAPLTLLLAGLNGLGLVVALTSLVWKPWQDRILRNFFYACVGASMIGFTLLYLLA